MKYSKKLLLIFILLAQVCFGQKVYKIKEGQLQFINAEEGIFIKKGDCYYRLQLTSMDNYEDLAKGFKYELNEVSLENLNDVKKDA